jgi:hypothetical protein
MSYHGPRVTPGVRKRIRRLRAERKTADQIGYLLGLNPSTVRNHWRGNDCIDCGAPIDREGKRCEPCGHFVQGMALQKWTDALIISRIQEWVHIHGEPPAVTDWNPWQARHEYHDEARARRYEQAAAYWPPFWSVFRRFNSWNKALEAAGFTPRRAGGFTENAARRRKKVTA